MSRKIFLPALFGILTLIITSQVYAKSEKVTICHCSKSRCNTLNISENSLPAHLNHHTEDEKDTTGACEETSSTNSTNPTNTDNDAPDGASPISTENNQEEPTATPTKSSDKPTPTPTEKPNDTTPTPTETEKPAVIPTETEDIETNTQKTEDHPGNPIAVENSIISQFLQGLWELIKTKFSN